MSEEIKKEQNLYTAGEMKKILQTAEMALWLDSYDDIFSDFDPRHYSERSLSDDFLLEMKKVVKDRGRDNYELKFLLAPETRNQNVEPIIKERLHSFFGKQYQKYIKAKKKVVRRGVLLVSLGVILMFIASTLITIFGDHNFLFNFIVILLEPAGWFLSWEGLSDTLSRAEKISPEIKFYQKMSCSKISFISY